MGSIFFFVKLDISYVLIFTILERRIYMALLDITKMNIPITRIDPNDNKWGVYIDYPLQFDEYSRQKILLGIEAAIAMTFRSFYGDRRLLPRVQGLFIDIQRYKHILANEYNRMRLNTIVNQALDGILSGLNPSIQVYFDEITQTMSYDITLDKDVEISVTNAETPLVAEITINTKRFYE